MSREDNNAKLTDVYYMLLLDQLDLASKYPKIVDLVLKKRVTAFSSLLEFFQFTKLKQENEVSPEVFLKKEYHKYKSRIYRTWSKDNVFFIFETGEIDLRQMMHETGLKDTESFYSVVSFFVDNQNDRGVVVKTATKQIPYEEYCFQKITVLFLEYLREYRQQTAIFQIKQRLLEYQIDLVKEEMDEIRMLLKESADRFGSKTT